MKHYLRKIFYSIVVTICCSASVTHSLFAADTLGTDYNLGRLPTGGLFENGFAWGLFGPYDLTSDLVHFRTGKHRNMSFGITPVLLAFSTKSKTNYLQLIPQFDVTWRSPCENRFYLSSQPMNLFFIGTGNGKGVNGLESPFTMLNSFEWEYLSRKGAIAIDERQYDLAFLYGPQLNAGQFRNRFMISKTVNSDTVPYRKFDVTVTPEIGISEYLQVQAEGHYSFLDSVNGTVFGYASDIGNFIIYEKSITDSFNVGLGLRYANRQLLCTANGGIYHWKNRQLTKEREVSGSYLNKYQVDFSEIRFNLAAAHLLGERITSLQELEGNWDAFESRWLGHGQWLNEIWGEYIPTRELTIKESTSVHSGFVGIPASEKDSSLSIIRMNQQTRYGLHTYFEVGEKVNLIFEDGCLTSSKIGINIVSCNIPIRHDGLNEISDHEYFHGVNLLKSHYFLSLHWFPPLFSTKYTYEFLPIYERVQLANAIRNVMNPVSSSSNSFFSGFRLMKNDAIESPPDFACTIAWAPLNVLTLANNLDIRTISFTPSTDSSTMQLPFVTSNTVISESFNLIINVSNASRLTLSTLYAQQSDNKGRDVQDEETRCFMVFIGFQTAISDALRFSIKSVRNK